MEILPRGFPKPVCRQPPPGKCIRIQPRPCKVQCEILPSDGKIAMRMAGSSPRGGATGTGAQGDGCGAKGISGVRRKAEDVFGPGAGCGCWDVLCCVGSAQGDALPLGKAEWEPWGGKGFGSRNQSCFMLSGGCMGCLKDPRVGFQGVAAQPCSGLGKNLIAPCPERLRSHSSPQHPLSQKLLGCERGDLFVALKPRLSEKVMTSPYKNNAEKPIYGITPIKKNTRQQQTQTTCQRAGLDSWFQRPVLTPGDR